MGTNTIESVDLDVVDEEPEERRPRWELAECMCPDYCERDHELD